MYFRLQSSSGPCGGPHGHVLRSCSRRGLLDKAEKVKAGIYVPREFRFECHSENKCWFDNLDCFAEFVVIYAALARQSSQ